MALIVQLDRSVKKNLSTVRGGFDKKDQNFEVKNLHSLMKDPLKKRYMAWKSSKKIGKI